MFFGRRLRFTMAILAAQVLLMAMAIAWCVQLVAIAIHGRVCFGEPHAVILYGEIAAVVLVAVFAAVVFMVQLRRLMEKRTSDNSRPDRRA
jgi:membrane protein implicated in regulation of membrane protease activity